MRSMLCIIVTTTILLAAAAGIGGFPIDAADADKPEIGPKELPRGDYFGPRNRLFDELELNLRREIQGEYRRLHDELSRSLQDNPTGAHDESIIAQGRARLKRQTMERFDAALRKSKSPLIKIELEILDRVRALREKRRECKDSLADDDCSEQIIQMTEYIRVLKERADGIWSARRAHPTTKRIAYRPYRAPRPRRRQQTNDADDDDGNSFSLAAITQPLKFIEDSATSLGQYLARNTAKMASDVVGNIPPGNHFPRPLAGGGALPSRLLWNFVPK